MTTKLTLKAVGASGSKQFSISNPVDRNSFDSKKAEDFVSSFNGICDSDLTLSKAIYIDTTETTVYPEP